MFPEGKEILVVDHDDTRRGRTAAILRDEGFSVISAREGLAALRTLGQRNVALVVAAIGLPGMLDGTTTVRQARVRRPGLKALMIAEPAELPRWRHRASDDAIAAPLQRWELLGCVFELLHRDTADEAIDLARRCRTASQAS